MERACDILLAAVLIGITLPLLLITAVTIKLEGPREPVLSLYPHPTMRDYHVLKFRTILGSQSRTRLTLVGRFLRYTRIEDLPQLLNVLRGDLTLIGADRRRRCFEQ